MRDDHIDESTVRFFLARLHAVVENAFAGQPNPGQLQLSVLSPRFEEASMRWSRWDIGNIEGMAEAAITAARTGLNVYVEGRTVDRRARGRGAADATVGVFALVDDSDADTGKAGVLALAPSLVVETSPGNRHNWLFLDRALTPEEVEPLGRAMRAAVGSDGATAKTTQPYRVAGTPNYPGPSKRARGRVPVPTSLLVSDGPVHAVEALRMAFPPVAAPSLPTSRGGAAAAAMATGASGPSDATLEDMAAATGGDRSARFLGVVLRAHQDGMAPVDVEATFRRHPAGCAGKYLSPTDRLAEEVGRAWARAGARLAPEPHAPTYPDAAVDVTAARVTLHEVIAGHFAAGPGCRAVRVGTGIGKTATTARVLAAEIRERRAVGDTSSFAYAVPRHRLGDEVAELFRREGITAQVFRGRQAEDPSLAETGRAMCWNLEAVKMAIEAGATVSTACCRGDEPESGATSLCPAFHDCSYQRQLTARPDVWVIPHQMLFHAHATLGTPAGVVVDESFWQAGVMDLSPGLTVDQLATVIERRWTSGAAIGTVKGYRHRLVQALRLQDRVGGVARRHLVAVGLTAQSCTTAIKAEWQLKATVQMWPGMTREQRKVEVSFSGALRRVKDAIAVWTAARELLQCDDPDAVSGRLLLAEATSPHGTIRVVHTRGLRAITQQWAEAPTLLLDATLPSPDLLRRFYPDVEVVAEVEARMPHARVRQVVGAPTAIGKLLGSTKPAAGGERREGADANRNLTSVYHAILARHVELGRPRTLVVAQQQVAAALRAMSLPDDHHVAVRHFNALSGLDGFGDVGLLIVVGRVLPTVLDVEAMAGALTGVAAVQTAIPKKGPRWYDRVDRGLRLADGTGVRVRADRHPDAMAEMVRWLVCEAELLQAIGRARGVNRSAATAVHVDLWTDVALPLALDEAMPWWQVPAGRDAVMAFDGIVLDTPAHVAAAWPAAWTTEGAARVWRSRARAGARTPIEGILYRGSCESSLRYQLHGAGHRPVTGRYDPRVIDDPAGWLAARLAGVAPLAWCEVDGERVQTRGGDTKRRAAGRQQDRGDAHAAGS